jgi:hypothetical protein
MILTIHFTGCGICQAYSDRHAIGGAPKRVSAYRPVERAEAERLDKVSPSYKYTARPAIAPYAAANAFALCDLVSGVS